MSVHKIQGGGYQYGKTGKKYYGPDAKEKADKQALAIRLSGYEEPHRSTKPKHRKSSRSELIVIGKNFIAKFFREE